MVSPIEPDAFDLCERCGVYYAFRDDYAVCWQEEGRNCVFPRRCKGERRVRKGSETDLRESKPMAKRQRTKHVSSDTSSGHNKCVVRDLERYALTEEPKQYVNLQTMEFRWFKESECKKLPIASQWIPVRESSLSGPQPVESEDGTIVWDPFDDVLHI